MKTFTVTLCPLLVEPEDQGISFDVDVMAHTEAQAYLRVAKYIPGMASLGVKERGSRERR